MKEYSILIRNKGGKPYYLEKYFTLSEVKKALYDIINVEEERGRAYYIDNDFYENKFPPLLDLKYMCVMVRDVTNYEKFSEKINTNITNNKILYFNFKK